MVVVFGEYSWQEAFYSIEALFEIESLFPEQKEAIKAFIEKDVSIFVSLPTGAGKSMIFQSFPFVFDSLYGNPLRNKCSYGHITVESTHERPSELPS